MRVFEEGRAVVGGEAVGVRGKVHGHDVEDATDARPVQRVHKIHELLWRSVAAGRRKEARWLVAPGAVEGILREWHELHVVVTEVMQVVYEGLGQLVVAIPVSGVIGGCLARALAPRTQVELVDVHGLVVAARTCSHPSPILPIVGRLADDAAVGGTKLHAPAKGVRMVDRRARMGDAVLIGVTLSCARNLHLPEVAIEGRVHLVLVWPIPLACILTAEKQHYAIGRRGEGAKHDAPLAHVRTQVALRVVLSANVEVVALHGRHPSTGTPRVPPVTIAPACVCGADVRATLAV